MKSIVFSKYGTPSEVLSLSEQAVPTPRRGEVLVRMIAAPINPSDLSYIRGTYTVSAELPATPGFEGVGVVESSGGGPLGWFLKGKRVAVLNDRHGNWSEYTIARAKQCIPIPNDITDEQAAGFFVNPATVIALIDHVLQIPRGAWLLQTAAGSSLGKMLIRLAKQRGIRTFNVVRRDEQVQALKALGADVVVVCQEQEVSPIVQKHLGTEPLRYAIDAVGGELGSEVIRCLSDQGRMIVYGALSGQAIAIQSRDLITGCKRIEGFWLGEWARSQRLPKKLKLIRQIRKLFREGVFHADVVHSYPLGQIQEAVLAAEMPGKNGKVLLKITASSKT